jgi:glycosyltransferase involved in cell wall biosynthesis
LEAAMISSREDMRLDQPDSREIRGEPGGAGSVIVISANSSWNIVNFRAGLVRALLAKGYRVVAVAPQDAYTPKISDMGATFINLPMNSAGISVVEDALLLLRYLSLFRRLRPFAFLGFTAKPNIYGSLAARVVGARIINNVSGLGTVFIKQGMLTWLVTRLYRLSLRGSSTVFFQNRDDMAMFLAGDLVRQNQARLLPGSGIDLDRFKPAAGPRQPGPLRFLFVARILWDKGVAEYVEAARLVRRSRPEIRFQMLGPLGANNRTAVPSAAVERWRAEKVVEYLGDSDDVRAAMAQADCIVLPSYREGLPRTLLEGSAMGKPLIATDVPGCRDVVVEGETGYLCADRSAEALAAAMLRMIDDSAEDRLAMGARGRRKVEEEFCESRVVDKYLDALGT